MEYTDRLNTMRGWILAEIEKSKRPGMEPFTMTSLTYCARKAVGATAAEELKAPLWEACRELSSNTFDVFTPDQAIGVVEWAIESVEIFSLDPA